MKRTETIITPKQTALELYRGGSVEHPLKPAGTSAGVSVLDRMAVFRKSVPRMGKSKPHQSGFVRQFTGWGALCLLLLINFKSAAFATALWLVDQHGHDHQITVQSDANHLNVRLSHDHDQCATDHHHENSLGLIASLFSTHDHDGADHVLHFNLNEVPDQIMQRNVVNTTPTPAPSVAITAISFSFTPTISTQSAAAIPPESPPPLTAGLLGLRTTVLLV